MSKPLETVTTIEQDEVEETVLPLLMFDEADEIRSKHKKLHTRKHIEYCVNAIRQLSCRSQTLDASRPWLLYWNLHALDLMGAVDEAFGDLSPLIDTAPTRADVVEFLQLCFDGDGYGGGPGQLAHLASTYAAVNALTIIGGTGFLPAYTSISRVRVLAWMKSLRNEDGSFRMHHGGEVDIRASYCVMSVATLLDIRNSELMRNAPDFVLQCQTYEGGFSCVPFDEAHGGYTFCATAAMILMHSSHRIHLSRLRRWTMRRQNTLMGGYNGRTNKLIDACYSFWCGGLFPFLEAIPDIVHGKRATPALYRIHAVAEPPVVPAPAGDVPPIPLANHEALCDFVLMACQDSLHGGLKDKPPLNVDHYHTCYALSGLAVASEMASWDLSLSRVNPVFNLCHDRVTRALQHFGGRTTI